MLQGIYIYERGSKNGKRVQSNMGAKNHGVIMPDANKEATLNAVSRSCSNASSDVYDFWRKQILASAPFSIPIHRVHNGL